MMNDEERDDEECCCVLFLKEEWVGGYIGLFSGIQHRDRVRVKKKNELKF